MRRLSHTTLLDIEARRICLIKPSAFGDVVQTLPFLSVLRQRFPRAEIHWVINRELATLIEGHPQLDRIIPFERRGGFFAWRELVHHLWGCRFDLVFDLQGLARTGLMTVATGAPVRVGLETAREGSSLTCNVIVPGTSREVPAHARYLPVARALGITNPGTSLLPVSPSDEAWAASVLQSLPRPVVAVHAGARWSTKQWPVERFATSIEPVLNQRGGSVIALGSGSEAASAGRLCELLAARLSANRIRNLAGQTTLKQLVALLGRVDLTVSNDSGPMHLAAAVGSPLVGIFTCTDPLRSGPPPSSRSLMVATEVACAGTYHKVCPL
ncbi:MAG TPA: glycosyltransferase family 9 protein, partial [Planctomycetaceae bacterium]|nr:glycosyltransferase family 9 protein [Planctomycetaceae bacterium]